MRDESSNAWSPNPRINNKGVEGPRRHPERLRERERARQPASRRPKRSPLRTNRERKWHLEPSAEEASSIALASITDASSLFPSSCKTTPRFPKAATIAAASFVLAGASPTSSMAAAAPQGLEGSAPEVRPSRSATRLSRCCLESCVVSKSAGEGVRAASEPHSRPLVRTPASLRLRRGASARPACLARDPDRSPSMSSGARADIGRSTARRDDRL